MSILDICVVRFVLSYKDVVHIARRKSWDTARGSKAFDQSDNDVDVNSSYDNYVVSDEGLEFTIACFTQ